MIRKNDFGYGALALLALLPAVGCTQGESSAPKAPANVAAKNKDTEPVKYSQPSDAKDSKKMQGEQKPPEYLGRHVSYMRYQVPDNLAKKTEEWIYLAGYYDPEAENVLYRWKGVEIDEDQVPGLERINQRTPILNIGKIKGIKQVEVDPPIRYWRLKSGDYAVGYWDKSEWRFFQWKGITLKKDELQADQPGYPPRVVPWPKHMEKEEDYLATIAAPAHLSTRPELWKSIRP